MFALQMFSTVNRGSGSSNGIPQIGDRSEEHTSELQSYTTLFRSQRTGPIWSKWSLQGICLPYKCSRPLIAARDLRMGYHRLATDRKSTRLNSSPTRRSSDLRGLDQFGVSGHFREYVCPTNVLDR